MPLGLNQLKGMDPQLVDKLRAQLITNSSSLLHAVATPQGRKALADKLGIDQRKVLELANRADLSRISGVGKVYSDLLEFAGVDTVAELAQRVPEHLHEQILTVADKHDVKRTPSLNEVKKWVAQAKELPRSIEY